MKMSRLFKYLQMCVKANIIVCLVGSPGIGKTSIWRAIAPVLKRKLLEIHVSGWDGVDVKGFPVVIDGIPRFVPFAELAEMLQTNEELIVLFDDLGHGSDDVLKNVMQLIRGKLGTYEIPENVYICCATNDTTDKAGVRGLIEPLKSSMVLLNVEHNADDSLAYAIANNWDTALINILRFNPDFWNMPEPTMKLIKTPCPREWERVNKKIAMFNKAQESGFIDASERFEMEYHAFKGCVGHNAATLYVSQAKIIRELPNPLTFIENPTFDQMPDANKHQSALYILTEAVCNLFAKPEYQTDMFRHNAWKFVSMLPDVFKRLAIGILYENDATFKTMAQAQDYRVLMAQDMAII